MKIVEAGRAKAVVWHAADATDTTKLAAREIQRVVDLATGVRLDITTKPDADPAIKLVSRADLPHDGFEIRRVGAIVEIGGNDRERPDQPDRWFLASHGTLYGAYEFLERFVEARWLLPGEWGEDVPRRESLQIELDAPLRGAPSFAVRELEYVGQSDPPTPGRPRQAVVDWMRVQRLSSALHPRATGYGHSWDDYLRPSDLDEHPEWKPSSGNAVRNGKVTFVCTTAPGLVEHFAKRLIETIDRNPGREMDSISPTDGGGFCTCERCEKLVVTDPHGRRSHAPAILDFYRRVGEIVLRERPGRRLGGLVYYNYQYPPTPAPVLPDNVSLCWAPLNYYGYGLLKPPYRDEFDGVLGRWSAGAPHFCYHNYSTWMRSFHGAPLPPSFDILRRELPAAARHRAWGARMVGTSAWGVNGPLNYVLARQMWNARLDVSREYDDWLARAYGPGWREMRRVADELDAALLAHKAAESPIYRGMQYEVNEEVMRKIYAPRFTEIERAYRATLEACRTAPQRKRLAMYGDNLIQLHRALRSAGLLAADDASQFRRDDAEYEIFLGEMESGFSLYRDRYGLYRGPIWKGEWRGP